MPPVVPPLLAVLALVSTPIALGALVLWRAHQSDKVANSGASEAEITG